MYSCLDGALATSQKINKGNANKFYLFGENDEHTSFAVTTIMRLIHFKQPKHRVRLRQPASIGRSAQSVDAHCSMFMAIYAKFAWPVWPPLVLCWGTLPNRNNRKIWLWRQKTTMNAMESGDTSPQCDGGSRHNSRPKDVRLLFDGDLVPKITKRWTEQCANSPRQTQKR